MQKILIHNSKNNNNNFHLILSLWQAFNNIQTVQAQISNPQSLRLMLKNFQPEIVIFFGGEEVSENLLESLKQKQNVKWVLWTTEDPFEFERNHIISKYFDFVFTSDKACKYLYQHSSCYYLPLAAEPKWFYHPVIEDSDNLLYDLIFIGTAWPNRIQFLKDLVESLRQNNLKGRFILPTNPYIPSHTLSAIALNKFERDFRVAPKDLATLQNYSRFALTLFRDFSGDGNVKPQSSPTNRFYETALAGTGQIIVSKDINILDFYPVLDKNVFQSQQIQEVVDIILRAKQNPEIRNKAAYEMQKFVLENHLYLHRAKEILSIIETCIH